MKYLGIIFIVTFVVVYLVSFKMLLGMNIQNKFKQGKIAEIRLYYFLKAFEYATIISLGVCLIVCSILTILNV